MRRSTILAPIVAAALSSGCLVEIGHVDDPRPVFREARAEASRYQGRPGPARQLNVLVFDPSDNELVRVSVPMWLARKICKKVDLEDDDFRIDFDGDRGDRVARRVRRHVRLEELEKAGRGILVEVEEDGGEQVLIWLR